MVDVPEETRALWRELTDRLIYASEKKKISWQHTADKATFIAAFGKNVVSFASEFQDFSERPDYVVKIMNKNGEVIDRFSDADLDRGRSGLRYYHSLENLYRLLHREQTGADATLKSIIEMLPDPNPDEIPF